MGRSAGTARCNGQARGSPESGKRLGAASPGLSTYPLGWAPRPAPTPATATGNCRGRWVDDHTDTP